MELGIRNFLRPQALTMLRFICLFILLFFFFPNKLDYCDICTFYDVSNVCNVSDYIQSILCTDFLV